MNNLAPLSLNTAFSSAFDSANANLRRLFKIFWPSIVVFDIIFFINVYLSVVGLDSMGRAFQSIYSVVALLAYTTGVIVAFALVDGHKENLNTYTLLTGWPWFLRVVGIMLLYGALLFAGIFVLVIPFFIILPTFFLAPYISVDKNLSILAAMKESAHLSRGYKWQILGLLVGFAALFVLILVAYIYVLGKIPLLFGLILLLFFMPLIQYMQIVFSEIGVHVYRQLTLQTAPTPMPVTPESTSQVPPTTPPIPPGAYNPTG